MRYIIVGASPPPRGGVAVYLERKVALLRKEGHIVLWLNPRRFFSFILLLLGMRISGDLDSIFELHTANPIALFSICFLGLEKRFVFYDHNYSETFRARKRFSRFILNRFISRVLKIVVVSKHLVRNYDFLNVDGSLAFIVETPYISFSDVPVVRGELDQAASIILENCQVVFINAAWSLVDDKDNNDLYGVEWSIESFIRLFSSNLNVGLILIVGGGSEAKLAALKEICILHPNIALLEGDHNLCNYLQSGKVVLLRTTTTDGDSLSVREAIELGASVVASDSAPRPEGANVYKLYCRTSFEEALMSEYRKITGDAQ